MYGKHTFELKILFSYHNTEKTVSLIHKNFFLHGEKFSRIVALAVEKPHLSGLV